MAGHCASEKIAFLIRVPKLCLLELLVSIGLANSTLVEFHEMWTLRLQCLIKCRNLGGRTFALRQFGRLEGRSQQLFLGLAEPKPTERKPCLTIRTQLCRQGEKWLGILLKAKNRDSEARF